MTAAAPQPRGTHTHRGANRHTPAVTTTDHSERIGVALAATGMLLISLDSLGFRLTEASSWDIAFWFGFFTTIAMVVVVRLQSGRWLPGVVQEQGTPLVMSGLLQSASTVFFILALGLTTVSNTVVIVAAAPIVAAMIAHFAIGERTALRVWAAIAVSFAGILIVVSGSFGAGRLSGDLFAVAAIVAFGANLTIWRRYPEVHRAAAIGIAGIVMVAVAVLPADPLGIDARALLILAVLGGVAGPAGRIAVAVSTRYLPTAQVSLFTPLETIAATAWAWLFLDEAPPQATIIGGLVVLAAVVYGATARTPAALER